MRLRDCLAKILIRDALSGPGEGVITLAGGQGKDRYKVELTGAAGEKASVIQLGKGAHSRLINENGGRNRICDYLILVPGQKNKALAIFCELKKTFKGKGGDQLRSTIPLLDYIGSMMGVHFDEKYSFSPRFVIIAGKESGRLSKQTTRPVPEKRIEFKGLDVRVILSDSIPFERLID